MPTYEYHCEACDHRFEQFQSITAAPLRKCPECGKSRLERLIGTGGGILFKGNGFYITDYRSESYRKAAEAETRSAAPAESKGAGDAGGKAAEKPAAAAATSGAGESKPAAAETPSAKPKAAANASKRSRKRS